MDPRLVIRLFGNKHDDDSSSDDHHTCPTHDLSEDATSPLFGSTSFYTFDQILGGSCAAFVTVAIFLHLFSHAVRLSNPSEQLKIMRIAFLLPFYAIISFLSIRYPSAEVYITPWVEVVQAHSICSFFLLMCDYISPNEMKRDAFFSTFVFPSKKKSGVQVDGLAKFKKTWILVFQYPVVMFILAIATDITQAAGVYCDYENKAYFAKLWIGIFDNISLALAFIAVLKFTIGLKSHLGQHNPMLKLFSFKIIVGLAFIQSILFKILDATDALNPTDTLTYADLHMGIPNLISCVELVPLCLVLMWAYNVRPYILNGAKETTESQEYRPQSYQGGPLGIWAFLAVLNPMEMLQAIKFALELALAGRRRADDHELQPLGYEDYTQTGRGGRRNRY